MAADAAYYVSTTGRNYIQPCVARYRQIFSGKQRACCSDAFSLFFSFAAGVALWGWLSDWFGRRPAIMAGLICYGAGSVMAIVSTDFSVLLLARMVAATGAAAGSVVVQTMLRDSYESTSLARVFSVMGAALALSPVFGLVSGGWLVSLYGHTGVFIALASLAIILLILAAVLLPETRPENTLRIRGAVWRPA